jgi:hypothetical protein
MHQKLVRYVGSIFSLPREKEVGADLIAVE